MSGWGEFTVVLWAVGWLIALAVFLDVFSRR